MSENLEVNNKVEETTPVEVKAKEKEKKPSFSQRLKAKVNALIESENLTFTGKIFLLGLYICGITGGSIIGISVLKTLVNIALNFFKVTYNGGIFTAACVLLWITFIITLIFTLVLAVIEAFVGADGKDSILEVTPRGKK